MRCLYLLNKKFLLKKYRKAVGTLLLLPTAATAQLRDTLPEQVISGKRIVAAPGTAGLKTLSIDSDRLLRPALTDISRILTENLPVFVRNTGINGPATLSIRGASAAQSMVLWEGIPLQNPAMGLTDLSLLQSGLFQNIRLTSGGSPALWGSGNVGGVLQLESEKPRFSQIPETGGFIGLGGGSFGLFNGMAGLRRSGPKTSWAVRAFGSRADYSFDYFPENGPQKHINNALAKQYGFLAQGAQQLQNGFLLRQDVWAMQSQRGIPPALFEAQSVKQQRDEALRIRLGLEKTAGRHELRIAGAFMRENLFYEDADVKLESALRTATFFGRAQYEYRFPKGRFFADAPLQYSLADTRGQSFSQGRLALAAGAEKSFWNEKLTASAALRAENTDAKTVVLPGANLRWRVLPGSLLRASVQRSYRAPTLSELYYFPGGNQDLKPEIGWSGEVGARQDFRKNSWQASVEATAFYRDIRDWIIWYGGAIWTPHNIARVHTKGLELEAEGRGSFSGNEIGLRSGFTYTQAQTVESAAPNDGSVGCQIPHTPLTTGRISGWISGKGFRLEGASVYTGYRFITADESAWIPGYWLHSASASYALALRKQTLHFELRCNNLSNEKYLSVAGRPGLPRHFVAGVMWGF